MTRKKCLGEHKNFSKNPMKKISYIPTKLVHFCTFQKCFRKKLQ
jgi:hypothetical protein